MAYFGVDPGKSGAIALVDNDGFTMNYVRLKETTGDISGFIKDYAKIVDYCIVEKVASRPMQGVKSVFTFGESFGLVQGLLMAHNVKFELHTPPVWMKKMGLITRGIKGVEKKRIHKQRAQELFMNSKNITLTTADAFLLAEYARRLDRGII